WMGTTLGCARCHDHKYDPISQRDFYRFFAFFNNVDEKGLDGRDGNAKPMLPLPDAAQEARLKELEEAIEAREEDLPDEDVNKALLDWTRSTQLSDGPHGALAHYELDGSFDDMSGNYRHARSVSGNPGFGGGVSGQSLGFDGEMQVDWGAFDADAFTVSTWFRLSNKLEQALLHKFDPAAKRGFVLRTDEAIPIGNMKRGSHLYLRLAGQWPDSAIELKTQRYIVQGDFTHIALSYD